MVSSAVWKDKKWSERGRDNRNRDEKMSLKGEVSEEEASAGGCEVWVDGRAAANEKAARGEAG